MTRILYLTPSVPWLSTEKGLIYNYTLQCTMKLLLWTTFLKMLSNNYFNSPTPPTGNCCTCLTGKKKECDGGADGVSCLSSTAVHADELLFFLLLQYINIYIFTSVPPRPPFSFSLAFPRVSVPRDAVANKIIL